MSKKIFYISDLHFGHANVLNYDSRPWTNVDEMNKDMIYLWNQRVGKRDTVYILGDFSMTLSIKEAKDIVNQLNGNKHLIRGNHDIRKAEFEELFESVQDYKEVADTVTIDGYPENTPVRVICSHYFMPFYNKNLRGAIMLHGHTHASREAVLEDEIKAELRKVGHRCEAYNVGAVYLNYAPRTLEEIIALQNRKVTL